MTWVTFQNPLSDLSNGSVAARTQAGTGLMVPQGLLPATDLDAKVTPFGRCLMRLRARGQKLWPTVDDDPEVVRSKNSLAVGSESTCRPGRLARCREISTMHTRPGLGSYRRNNHERAVVRASHASEPPLMSGVSGSSSGRLPPRKGRRFLAPSSSGAASGSSSAIPVVGCALAGSARRVASRAAGEGAADGGTCLHPHHPALRPAQGSRHAR